MWRLDHELATRILFQEDPTSLLLRGYLLVEASLNELVRATFEDPEAFDHLLARLPFLTKVSLAEAQGVLIWTEPLRVLNNLRNQIAHRPEQEVDDLAIQRLLSAFGDEFGQLGDGETLGEPPRVNAGDSPATMLRSCLLAMVGNLHAHAMSHMDHRIRLMRDGNQRLERLLGGRSDSD